MRVFICGIIQGSRPDLSVHGQSYRQRLRQIVEKHLPEAEVYCPVSLHPESPSYDIELWEAKRAGVRVVSVTPLKDNWVIRYASDVILADFEEVEAFLKAYAAGKTSQ